MFAFDFMIPVDDMICLMTLVDDKMSFMMTADDSTSFMITVNEYIWCYLYISMRAVGERRSVCWSGSMLRGFDDLGHLSAGTPPREGR